MKVLDVRGEASPMLAAEENVKRFGRIPGTWDRAGQGGGG